MNRIILLLLSLVIISACNDTFDGYKFYFFPVDDFDTPKVYAYRNQNDNKDNIYYALKSIREKDSKYLHIEVYDKDFNKIESLRQKVTENGVFAVEYYTSLDSKEYKMKIYSDTVLLWDYKNNDKFVFEASCNIPESRNQQHTKKIKWFTGKSGTSNFSGVDYKTIEVCEDCYFNDSYDKVSIKKSKNYYARGLGMIGFTLNESDNSSKNYKLDKILNFNEWKRIQN